MNASTANRPDVITPKALIVGLFLVVVNAYWVGIASELWYAVYTLVSPFSNAVFTLVVLLGLNVGLRKFLPRIAFTTAETAPHLYYGDDGVHHLRSCDDGDSDGDACAPVLVCHA